MHGRQLAEFVGDSELSFQRSMYILYDRVLYVMTLFLLYINNKSLVQSQSL